MVLNELKECLILRYGPISNSCVVRQFYAGGKISACCLIQE